jgi:hypothetical protein
MRPMNKNAYLEAECKEMELSIAKAEVGLADIKAMSLLENPRSTMDKSRTKKEPLQYVCITEVSPD